MKGLLIGLLAGMLLATAGGAVAAAIRIVPFNNGDTATYKKVACRAMAKAQGFICLRQDGVGYIVGISHTLVMVQNEDGKVLFVRAQGSG